MASALAPSQLAANVGRLAQRRQSCQGCSVQSGQVRSQPCHALLTPSLVAQPQRGVQLTAVPAILTPTRDNDGTRRSRLIAAASSAVREVPGDQFESEVLKADVPVLVDFWATWCGPCRLIVPVLDWAAKEYEGKLKVVKMEVDANPTLVEQYKVYGLPTVILFQGGEVVPGGHFEGALTKAKLKELLSEKLPALTPTAAAS